MRRTKITIDIVSDVVCPWCLIGYKRLEKALREVPAEVECEVRWHPFELNPDMPDDGQDLAEHMGEKYGSTPAQSADSRQLLKAVGLSLGVEINFLKGARIVNTFRAHQLLHWAKSARPEVVSALEMALFQAYFTHGQDVNDLSVLQHAAAKVGLDGEEAISVLDDGRYKLPVRQNETMWLHRGVRAVPTFVFDDKFAMSGAREPAELTAVLQQVLADRKL